MGILLWAPVSGVPCSGSSAAGTENRLKSCYSWGSCRPAAGEVRIREFQGAGAWLKVPGKEDPNTSR